VEWYFSSLIILIEKEGCQLMSNLNGKDRLKARPVEKHATAAWANIEKMKEISNVAIPSEIEVGNSKQWVDNNQK
jgi:Domain of unknown function (DUF3787)